MEFEPVQKGLTEKTSVWHYFLRDKSGNLAKCTKCNNKIKTCGGSTSGLHTHLRTAHDINLLKKRELDTENLETSTNKSTSAVPTKLKKISSYFKNENDDLRVVLSKMTAVDGLPFSIFITSIELRKSLLARKLDVPKSANTIRNIVLRYGLDIREEMVKDFSDLKKEGKFSLTFDEWTSGKNRRYLNLNLHIKNKFWNLGLIRIVGTFPAESCVELITKKLEKYKLSFDEDIVCITTDGASLMKKVGRIVKCHQQLCYAHGIQLAVLDVLYCKNNYKKNTTNLESERETEINSDSDAESDVEENDIDGFKIADSYDNSMDLKAEIRPLINKVRKVVKIFRRSPTKNDDILQKYVKSEFNKEISLILATKTRWNSLFFMLQRFWELRTCILKSLIDLGSTILFEEAEMDIISGIISTLMPIKLAVESLCRRDATLLSADATIVFMINNLGSGQLSDEFKISLARRINERRTKLSSLLQYLHKGQIKSKHQDNELSFEQLSKTDVVNLISTLVKRLSPDSNLNNSTNSSSHNISSSSSDSSDLEMNYSMQERLNFAINKEKEIDHKVITKKPGNLDNTIKKEMAIFEEGGSRGINLQKAYDYLNTIPPTSVEAERAFSSSGKICSKIRSSLSDDSLDTLCFLRSYFLSKQN